MEKKDKLYAITLYIIREKVVTLHPQIKKGLLSNDDLQPKRQHILGVQETAPRRVFGHSTRHRLTRHAVLAYTAR